MSEILVNDIMDDLKEEIQRLLSELSFERQLVEVLKQMKNDSLVLINDCICDQNVKRRQSFSESNSRFDALMLKRDNEDMIGSDANNGLHSVSFVKKRTKTNDNLRSDDSMLTTTTSEVMPTFDERNHVFESQTDLKIHVKSDHQMINSFVCNECHNVFTSRDLLSQHMTQSHRQSGGQIHELYSEKPKTSSVNDCSKRVDSNPNLCPQMQISSAVNGICDHTNETVIMTTDSSSFGFDDNGLRLKLVKVAVNRMMEVKVAFIESPSNFWLHINVNDVLNYIHMIQVKQEEMANNADSVLTSDKIKVGMYCAAKWTDGYWYRAQVNVINYENRIESDAIKTVCVHYIDWGNTEELPLNSIMKLSNELTKRKQAILCHLQGWQLDSVKWSEKAVKDFKKLLNNKKLSATFHKGLKLHERHEKYRYPIDLMIIFNDENIENVINYLPIPEIANQDQNDRTFELIDRTIELNESVEPNVQTVDAINPIENGVSTPETMVCVSKMNGHSDEALGTNESKEKLNEINFDSNQNGFTESNEMSKSDTNAMFQMTGLRIPVPIIPESNELIVNASHIVSPSLFFIHINDTQVGIAQLDELNEQLNTCYSSWATDRVTEKSDVLVDSFWCCKYSCDQCWYRVRVIEVAEEKALVNYVDYGNEEWVQFKDLMPLTRKFANCPALAVKCCLYNVFPFLDEWPQKTVDYFESFIDDQRLCTAFIAQKPNEFTFDSILNINLWINESNEPTAKDILINYNLVLNDHAVTNDLEWFNAAEREKLEKKTLPELSDQLMEGHNDTTHPIVNDNLSIEPQINTKKVKVLPELADKSDDSSCDGDWDPMMEDHKNGYLNSYAIAPNDAGMATIGFRPAIKRTCKFFSRGQGCRMGDLCSFLHVDPQKRFALDDSEDIPLHIEELHLKVDSYVKLKVNLIESPFSFYGTFGTSLSNKEFIEENPNFKQLNELLKLLKEKYSKTKNNENLNIHHGIGSLVLYRDQNDNYFRGRVKEIDVKESSGDMSLIFNIDSGILEYVKRCDIFKLDRYFCEFPALAIQCSLTNICPIDRWNKESNTAFGEWTLNRNLMAHIMYGNSIDNKYYIELIERVNDQKVFISDRLICHKFAQRLQTNGFSKSISEDDIYDSDLD